MSGEFDPGPGLRMEQRIDAAETDAITERWQFGRWMLTHVPEGGKKLPDGFLERLTDATGKSRAELKYRRQFAERFPTDEALATAVANHRSWTEIREQALSDNAHVSDNVDGDEWDTPRWLLDALGLTYDLDVCAPADPALSAVTAHHHYTAADDGLAQPWAGTVWCNPPYSQPGPWAQRSIEHADGLLLTHIPMNAEWCADVWQHCDAIRLFQAIEFARPDTTTQRPGYWCSSPRSASAPPLR